MKKLSFLMAMILILSSLFAVPVFADTTYTYDGANTATDTFAAYTANKVTTTSGLTSTNDVAGPLKTSTDKVYHVSGTSTVTDSSWYKYCFNKAMKGVTDFTDKTSYTFSMDLFFPSKDATTKNEITVQAGIGASSSKTLVLTFRTGDYKDTDVGVGKSSGKVFYGLEKDKWHNIVINVSFADKKTIALDVYKDGVKFTEHYSCNSSNVMTKVESGTVSPSAYGAAISDYYLIGRPTLDLVTDDKFDFYFDNVIYKSGVTYSGDTPATISKADAGVVTVDAGTTAEQVAALATGASAVEVYRADASALGFTQVTGEVAKDDIIKLVTKNGAYSYYKLDVKTLSYSITYDGTTKAPTSDFAKDTGLTFDLNTAGPLKTSADKVYHAYGTSTVADSSWWRYCFHHALKGNTDFTEKTNYTFSIDLFFPSKDTTTNKEFVVQAGINAKALVFTFRSGEYAENDKGYGTTSGKVFYGLEEDRWNNIVINLSYDDSTKTEVFDIYKDGVKFTQHYSCDSSNKLTLVKEGTITPTAVTSDTKGYYLIGRPSLNYVVGEKHDIYFDNVIYKADATYTGDTPATISTAKAGVVTVEKGTTAEQVAALATGAASVEVYRADASAIGFTQVTGKVESGDVIKLVTKNGAYSYYTIKFDLSGIIADLNALRVSADEIDTKVASLKTILSDADALSALFITKENMPEGKMPNAVSDADKVSDDAYKTFLSYDKEYPEEEGAIAKILADAVLVDIFNKASKEEIGTKFTTLKDFLPEGHDFILTEYTALKTSNEELFNAINEEFADNKVFTTPASIVNSLYDSIVIVGVLNAAPQDKIEEKITSFKDYLPQGYDSVLKEYADLKTSNKAVYDKISETLADEVFATTNDVISTLCESVAIESLKVMENFTEFTRLVNRVGEEIGLDTAKYETIVSPRDATNVDKAIIELKNKDEINTLADLIKEFSDACDDELARDVSEKTTTTTTSRPKGSNSSPTYSGGTSPVVGVPLVPEVTEDDIQKTPSPFKDLNQNHWAYVSVISLVNDGVISGYENETFAPNNNIKREEIIKMLISALDECDANAITKFEDCTTSDWFYPYVATAYSKGYVNGISDVAFGSGRFVTRQDSVVMIYNIVTKLGKTLPSKRTYTDFGDEDKIASYAKDAVKALYCAEIIDGTGAGFNPDGSLTRAEAAKIIYGVLKIVKG